MSQDNYKEAGDTAPQEENGEPEVRQEQQPEEEAACVNEEKAASEKKPSETQEADAKAEKKSGTKKDPKEEKIEELQDRLVRQMAEFDNFRKRTEKEKSSMYEIGARDIIEKLLPVLDNFERGLSAMPDEEKESSFAEGIEMIYKQLWKMLEDAGVEKIEAEGQPFDPNLHNAVMHVDDDSLGENVVSQELQKGYKYRGTVVRHSMVQVAN